MKLADFHLNTGLRKRVVVLDTVQQFRHTPKGVSFHHVQHLGGHGADVVRFNISVCYGKENEKILSTSLNIIRTTKNIVNCYYKNCEIVWSMHRYLTRKVKSWLKQLTIAVHILSEKELKILSGKKNNLFLLTNM